MTTREDEMVALATYLRRCCEQSRTRSAMTAVPAGSLLEAADALTTLSSERDLLRAAVIEARLARLNWQKYNGEQGDEVVYQAEKMASAIDKIDAALTGVTGG